VSEEFHDGDYVAVVGMLDAEPPSPSSHALHPSVVIVESIEALDQRAL
jgi:hypothetical protein